MTEDDIRRIAREEALKVLAHPPVGGILDGLIANQFNAFRESMTTDVRGQALALGMFPDLPHSLVPAFGVYLADKIKAAVPPL